MKFINIRSFIREYYKRRSLLSFRLNITIDENRNQKGEEQRRGGGGEEKPFCRTMLFRFKSSFDRERTKAISASELRADINLFYTYPPFAPNVFELSGCGLPDALRAPQFQTDPGVGECHGSDW